MNHTPRVLIVGAGPTGLTLALQAREFGASVRIVDRRAGIAPSRALIMHPLTLEGLRPLGVVDRLMERADVRPAAELHLGDRVIRARLADLAIPDTAFPHLTLVRQAEVEAVLAEALVERDVTIERCTEVTALHDDGDGDGAVATLQSGAAGAMDRFDFIVGCDGQASCVREAADIAWRGRRYAEEVVLADVELDADLDRHQAHVVVGRGGVLLVFPLGERATWRVLATRLAVGSDRACFGQPGLPVHRSELQALLDHAGLPARITTLAWSARYPVQRRLADHFRNGRFFLAGDAAHAHSPALGQGMNLGIQDALNLGWKLACSSSAQRPEKLLDSYEQERRPFDRRVIALTHVAFWGEAGHGAIPELVRGTLGPLVAPALPGLLRCRPLLGEGVRFISQLRAGYRHSPISMDSDPPLRRWPPPGTRPGDRTVAVNGRRLRLQTLLARPGFHVLLEREAAVPDDLPSAPRVWVHRLMDVAGRGVVVVRPDGYIGMRASYADAAQVRLWLATNGAARVSATSRRCERQPAARTRRFHCLLPSRWRSSSTGIA